MPSLVSVLLPVYNGEKYLRGAIESVLAQEYPRFEFVIADNASSDGTAEIIESYSGDPRVRVIRGRETVSRLENFNRVFAAASKESNWYKFVGDDDRLLPNCLDELVRAGESGDKAGLVCSYYYNGEKLVTGALPAGVSFIEGPQILKKMLLEPEARSTIFSPASLLIRPQVFWELGPFRTDLLHADAELFYRILNSCNLACAHQPLVKIGFHADSGQALSEITGHTFAEAYLIRYHNLKRYDKVKLTRLEVERIKNNLVLDSTGYMLARCLKGDFLAALKHLRAIPAAALHHLPLGLCYFILLFFKKLFRGEPVRLLRGRRRGRVT